MNLFAYVGVNLGVLSLLAITPMQKPTLNDETYRTHLFMLDMGNWEREMKERSWAESQPCVDYEPQAEEEKEEATPSVLLPGSEVDVAVIVHPIRQEYASITPVETELQSSPRLSQGGVQGLGQTMGSDLNEQTASEETGRDDSGEPTNAPAILEGSEETPAEESATMETASQPSPLFEVDGYVPDVNLQEYLYSRLAENGIEWFMPYAVCLIAQESSWNPMAVNPNGRDKGILQYRVEFHNGLDWTNPYAEIDLFVQQMANRAMSGKTVSEMISAHMMSDYGDYNQAYVDAVMSHSGSLVRVR